MRPPIRVGLAALALAALAAALLWRDATSPPPDAVEPAAARPGGAPSTAETLATPHEAPPASRSTRNAVDGAQSPEVATVEPGLPLVVHTRASYARDAKAVGNLDFEVGVGIALDPDARVLGALCTDEHGDARLVVSWPAIESARAEADARLWARLRADGFQARHCLRPLPEACEPQELTVIAAPGGTLVGRLFDVEGEPCAGLVGARSGVGDNPSVRGLSIDPSPNGWFAIHFAQAGVYDLAAVGEDGIGGTAARPACSVVFTQPPQRLDLRLCGDGTLRGRVLDAHGAPAAGLQLAARSVELCDESADRAELRARRDALACDGRGRAEREAITDSTGRFEMRGVRIDRFHVFARAGERFRDPDVRLTPEPVSSVPGADLELTFSRPHLAVRILEPDGSLWPGVAELREPFREWTGEWPAKPTLVVVRPRDDPTAARPEMSTLAGCFATGGEYVFECQRSGVYRVGLLGGDQPWRPIDVLVPADAGRVEVELERAPPARIGALLITARAGENALDWGVVRWAVEDPADGFALAESPSWSDVPPPWRVELPEGDYRVVVEGSGRVDSHHGILRAPRSVGRGALHAHVEAAEEKAVEVEVPAGARLRLTVSGVISDADRAAVQRPGWVLLGPVDDSAGAAQIALLAHGRRPEPVWFARSAHEGTSSAGTHLFATLALGATELSEIVAAGRYELVATLPGGRVASAPVTLIDGSTTDVTLEFR